MPHDNDAPRDLKSRLKHFNLFESTPRKYIEARDPVIGAVQDKVTHPHNIKGPGILGWDDIFKKNAEGMTCRWCGTEMYFHHEDETGIYYGCKYPLCENNPDTPESMKNAKKAKRAMNTKERNW